MIYMLNPTQIWPWWLVLLTAVFTGVVLLIIVHGSCRAKSRISNSAWYEEKIYLYKLPVRIWHWLNAVFFTILLAGGLLKHFDLIGKSTFKVFHGGAAKIFIILWVLFILYNGVCGNGKYYIVSVRGFLSRCVIQVKYYLNGIMKGYPHPYKATSEAKFNPLQQITYIIVIYLMIPALIATGIFMKAGPYFKELHLVFSMLGLIFLTAHIYLSTTGSYPTQLIKGMIDGYHRHNTEPMKLKRLAQSLYDTSEKTLPELNNNVLRKQSK